MVSYSSGRVVHFHLTCITARLLTSNHRAWTSRVRDDSYADRKEGAPQMHDTHHDDMLQDNVRRVMFLYLHINNTSDGILVLAQLHIEKASVSSSIR